ncbi:radical SAM family heme chaperone HemW [Maioricimonas rarisocia]|uniref:radical SAM family heme chaperone HemW n=1 Tax=Maioricimonas rarisocia TaxID=2528026 RepID=UPI001E377AEC|nr:radical SAM family heme chaperone HemW [Maioricimonas rarisocia]
MSISADLTGQARAAYVHVPFCAHRCGYCDFTLVAGRDDLIDDYLAALEVELRSLGHPRQVDTLFFGGGTPTHLPADQLDRLLKMVLHWFEPTADGEFSVEANPYGLDGEKVQALARNGVNRVSLGVQSFDAAHLETLERDHRRDDIVAAMERLRGSSIRSVGIDLIFAVPGQTVDNWRSTLDQAIALAPDHISTYGLTFERGTAFWSRKLKGTLRPVPDETERGMYALAMDRLPEAGFQQYEISNFARPGHRSRHNEVYWRAESHYGVGPGAAAYLDGTRRLNHRSVTTWIRRTLAGQPAHGETETLSPEDRAREGIMLGLRKVEGVERDRFAHQFGLDLDELVGSTIQEMCGRGWLEDTGEAIRLTREGRFVADTVIAEFL